MSGLATRVVSRYLAAKNPLPKQFSTAVKDFASNGDTNALRDAFEAVQVALKPGGATPGWYHTLAPIRRRMYLNLVNSGAWFLEHIEAHRKGQEIPEKFRQLLPLYEKELSKFAPVLDSLAEETVIMHGPWKVINLAGAGPEALDMVFDALDKASALLGGRFSKLIHGTVHLGNRSSGGHGGSASYDPKNDTVQLNMKAVKGNDPLLKSFLHELGHRFWTKFANSADRIRFMKLSDTISVSEYGATHYTENFADGFAFYALKRPMQPEMIEFFDTI